MSSHQIFGSIATFIAIISYLPYIKDILIGKTKPHVFTWIIWFSLGAIGLAAQLSDNAGPAAWVTAFTVGVAAVILCLSFVRGNKEVVLLDWISLFGAGLSLLLWYITKQPTLSVILVACVDFLGTVPTIRKSYFKPQEETISAYLMSGIKYVIAIFALNNISIVTALYPLAYSIFFNTFFVSLLVIRRIQLGYKVEL